MSGLQRAFDVVGQAQARARGVRLMTTQHVAQAWLVFESTRRVLRLAQVSDAGLSVVATGGLVERTGDGYLQIHYRSTVLTLTPTAIRARRGRFVHPTHGVDKVGNVIRWKRPVNCPESVGLKLQAAGWRPHGGVWFPETKAAKAAIWAESLTVLPTDSELAAFIEPGVEAPGLIRAGVG